jgi:hypothetical protein
LKIFNTEEHPDVADTLECKANLYSYFGKKDKALEIHEKIYSK